MPDEHYENPKLAAVYDVFCPWGVDRDFYLSLAGEPPQHVLDLGCGTGLLCEAYAARGHNTNSLGSYRKLGLHKVGVATELQEERFLIIAGTLRGRVAGEAFASGPGETIVVPRGAPHVWWNAGDEELHCLVDLRPALRIEHFFETFFGLAQDGKVDPKTGLPNPLQLAVIMRTFREELILAQPPRLVQTALFGTLAPVGRLLGYRGEYPYPHVRQAPAS